MERPPDVEADAPGDVRRVNVDSLELTRPRSVGVEHAALQDIDCKYLSKHGGKLG